MKQAVSAVLAGVVFTIQAAAAAPAGMTWYGIAAENGDVLGYAFEKSVQTPQGRAAISGQEITRSEKGSAPSVISSRGVTTEDAAGRALSIVEYSGTADDWTRTVARIGQDSATVTRETPHDRTVKTVRLPAGVRFDFGKGLLLSWDPAHAPKLAFDNFDPDAAVIQHIVIEAQAGAPPGLDGGIAALRKIYEGDQLMAVVRLTLDRDRHLLSSSQPMFGSAITVRVTDRKTALTPHPPYRVLANAMKKSPFRISDAAAHGHIRYRFSFRDGIDVPMPQTGEQAAVAGPGFTVVDICADCGPGLPSDTETLTNALKPTVWLQSDDPRIKAIAEPVAKQRISDADKMEMLRKITSYTISRVDFVGYYSAVEALERRAGDCTETAVLLAALGRAAGIPTLVADGLVYSQERYHGASNVFMPHSWTIAWVDGKWRSFDAALDSFDSTHIAVIVGDGGQRAALAANQLAGLLQWDGMGEVKKRPGI